MKKNYTICMYGSASDNIAPIYMTETEKLGREIGKRGHALVYGGGACGLMGACARGVQAEGGRVTAVVPDFMVEIEELNKKATEFINTATMSERKVIMEKKADAFVICPGGIGTFDEFFEILALISLGRKQAPIVLYNIDGYYTKLIDLIDQGIDLGFINANVRQLFFVCSEAENALDLIEHTLG